MLRTDIELHLVKGVVWAIGEKSASGTMARDSFGEWTQRGRVGHPLWRNGLGAPDKRDIIGPLR